MVLLFCTSKYCERFDAWGMYLYFDLFSTDHWMRQHSCTTLEALFKTLLGCENWLSTWQAVTSWITSAYSAHQDSLNKQFKSPYHHPHFEHSEICLEPCNCLHISLEHCGYFFFWCIVIFFRGFPSFGLEPRHHNSLVKRSEY